MYRNAVLLLMAWSVATVTAVLDSARGQRYWDDVRPDDAARYPHDNALKNYVYRGGNKHFVTSIFPGMYRERQVIIGEITGLSCPSTPRVAPPETCTVLTI